MGVIVVVINNDVLAPYLLYSDKIRYNDKITLYPIRMKNIIDFETEKITLTVRKDSIFREKKILKMNYLQFIKYSYHNIELAEKYDMPYLPVYYDLLLQLLHIVCGEESEIAYNTKTLDFTINEVAITDSIFDDLRRIIILQNGIDFDVDEFIHIDTIKALEKARDFEEKKKNEHVTIEDYIDSLVIGMNVTEDFIKELSIRKFWRYIKRINMRESYTACLNGSLSGMVTFKEPFKHWMISLDSEDKYENLKADESELRSKII